VPAVLDGRRALAVPDGRRVLAVPREQLREAVLDAAEVLVARRALAWEALASVVAAGSCLFALTHRRWSPPLLRG
jgi:hypothetical protein